MFWHGICHYLSMVQEMNIHVALFANETSLATAVKEVLELSDLQVDAFENGLTQEVQKGLDSRLYDVCLIFGTNQEDGGKELLRSLREVSEIPAILVLKESNKEEVIATYQLGADDVQISPISTEVLACKIKALIGRLRKNEKVRTEYQIGQLVFSSETQQITRGDELLSKLSGRESELLSLLLDNENRLVERSYILRKIWKVDNYFNSRSLAVYVNRLRHLLESEPQVHILSIHGKGYKLCKE